MSHSACSHARSGTHIGMMTRLALASAAIALAASLGAPAATAQSTEQTDQSEEDWRRSQKTSSGDPFDPSPNSTPTGWGTTLPDMRPIDQLPEESRRHLMRQRARVIAEMEFGEARDAAYEPSEAARSDPDLAAEEEAVWETILTDLKGSRTPAQGAPQDGPHKVAVAGQGSAPAGSALGGGSNKSAAEILAELKGLKAGGGSGGPGAPGPQSGEAASGQPSGTQTGPASASSEPASSGQADQPAGEQPAASGEREADATGSAEAGAEPAGADAANEAGEGAQPAPASQPRRPDPPSSLLERPRAAEDRDSTGGHSSASDYLKSGQAGPDR